MATVAPNPLKPTGNRRGALGCLADFRGDEDLMKNRVLAGDVKPTEMASWPTLSRHVAGTVIVALSRGWGRQPPALSILSVIGTTARSHLESSTTQDTTLEWYIGARSNTPKAARFGQ